MKGFLKYFFAILLASVLAYVINFAFTVYMVGQAAKAAEKSLSDMAEKQQQRLADIKAQQAEQQRQQLIAAEMQRQAQQRMQADAAAKERAWNTFYKEPKGCNAWQDDRQMVACVNNKMEQKQKFEQAWSSDPIHQI